MISSGSDAKEDYAILRGEGYYEGGPATSGEAGEGDEEGEER
jgi:hypothetical protein